MRTARAFFIGGLTANKLPWFTHDHNARNDDFIRRAEDQFGHFGYAAYFKILELIHEHGVGDCLRITESRLCQELRSRRAQVGLLLDFCRTSGKMEFTSKSGEVHLQIKKFREKQSKLKSKLPSTFRQPSVNLPQEKEKEKEKEKDIAGKPAKQESHPIKTVRELSDVQKLIRYFKEAKGVNADDKDWDRRHFCGRLVKEATEYLKAFDGNVKIAGEYLLVVGEEWKDLPDWSMPGAKAKAGRDPRLNGTEGEHGHENGALDANSLDGKRRTGGLTSARAIAGDTLRAIEATAFRAKESPVVAGPPEDSFIDGEDFS